MPHDGKTMPVPLQQRGLPVRRTQTGGPSPAVAEPDGLATPADLAAADLRIVRLPGSRGGAGTLRIRAGHGIQDSVTEFFRTAEPLTSESAWVLSALSAGRWPSRRAALKAARRYIEQSNGGADVAARLTGDAGGVRDETAAGSHEGSEPERTDHPCGEPAAPP